MNCPQTTRSDSVPPGSCDGQPVEAAAQCCICICEMDSKGPQRLATPRGCEARHMFHEDCIVEWATVSTTCPTCRKEFSAIDALDSRGNVCESHAVRHKSLRNDDTIQVYGETTTCPACDELAYYGHDVMECGGCNGEFHRGCLVAPDHTPRAYVCQECKDLQRSERSDEFDSDGYDSDDSFVAHCDDSGEEDDNPFRPTVYSGRTRADCRKRKSYVSSNSSSSSDESDHIRTLRRTSFKRLKRNSSPSIERDVIVISSDSSE